MLGGRDSDECSLISLVPYSIRYRMADPWSRGAMDRMSPTVVATEYSRYSHNA
jgi:hypothetical protein